MNLRAIKSKIKSIKNVGQITKAMQLVSAVKMKKAQLKASMGLPYRNALTETIAQLVSASGSLEHPYTQPNKLVNKRLGIIISSNKGLCGVFNFNLFKFLFKEIKDFDAYDFVIVGAKAQQFLHHFGARVTADFSQELPFEKNVSAIYSLILSQFLSKQVSGVDLFYNRFVTSMTFEPTKKTLLPLTSESFSVITPENKVQNKNYLIEPDSTRVLAELFNFYIEGQIRGAISESEASEHSARMVAMKNATDNAKDLVYQLTLTRNAVRQSKITNELLDMNTAKLAVSNA